MLNSVIIYDCHPLIVNGLTQVLAARGYAIADAVSDPAKLIHALVLDKPSLLVMDMQGLSERHLKQLQLHRKQSGDYRLFIYANSDNCLHAAQRLKLDVQGYLNKSFGPEAFNAVLDEMEQGKRVMMRAHHQIERSEQDLAVITSLTHRERQVLQEIGAGKANKQIAEELQLSTKTVSTYKRAIMQKMQTQKTCDVVDFAQRNGF